MSDYAFVHNGRAYTPNQTTVPPAEVAAHNAQLERAELARWADRPEVGLMYYQFADGEYQKAVRSPRCQGATVRTWLGTVTGQITAATIYRHNFGARFVSLRVRASNGAEYWGRASWDGGSCVVLRKVRAR